MVQQSIFVGVLQCLYTAQHDTAIITAVILFMSLSNWTDDMQEIQKKKADQIEKILAN